MILLTTYDFVETIFTKDINKLAVVQFSAPWCSSCEDVLPTINQLEKDYTNVLFFKVDVDKSPELADNYNVNKLPTFLFIKNRKVENFIIGNETIDIFKKIIEKEMK